MLNAIAWGLLNLQSSELSISTINLVYEFSVWFWLLYPSSDHVPSRDAVDDQFQHTLDVLASIMKGQSNSQAQELLIGMLDYVEDRLIKFIAYCARSGLELILQNFQKSSSALLIVIQRETKISKSDLFPPIFTLINTYNWNYSEKIREGKRFAYWT